MPLRERPAVSQMVSITVDGRVMAAPAGTSVLAACDQLEVYIPRLCAYPGLEPLGDCGLCFVGVSASEGAPAQARRACSVKVSEGMVVTTAHEEALGYRRSSMEAILGDHPHVCLTCPQRDGCSRVECMYGYPEPERCCGEFGRCEIAKVAAYVGALERAPKYQHRGLGVTQEGNIRRDLDLCVGCGRCRAACDTLEEAGQALTMVQTAELVVSRAGEAAAAEWEPRSYLSRQVAVPKAQTLRSSGCTFCGACIMVCPSGALSAPGTKGASWLAKRKERTTLSPAVLPREEVLPFTPEALASVPVCAGVFRLLNQDGAVLQISGVADLRAGLQEVLSGPLSVEAATFSFEGEAMYTQRESELLARHVQEHGSLPEGNDVLGDLFDDDEDLF